MITTWYLHSHRTWEELCHSCIGSSFLPFGAFLEGGAYVIAPRIARSSSGRTARGRGFMNELKLGYPVDSWHPIRPSMPAWQRHEGGGPGDARGCHRARRRAERPIRGRPRDPAAGPGVDRVQPGIEGRAGGASRGNQADLHTSEGTTRRGLPYDPLTPAQFMAIDAAGGRPPNSSTIFSMRAGLARWWSIPGSRESLRSHSVQYPVIADDQNV